MIYKKEISVFGNRVHLIFFSLLFLSIQTISTAQNTHKKPNIVLINVDDLGWMDLGFMGSSYYETPNIDALANQGMVFTNAYASAANCAPSRACMLSGLNTPKHGVYTVGSSERGHKKNRKLIPIKNTKHLKDSIYTLPEMLKSAGYLTASIGKWHVNKNPNIQGIDVNVGGSEKGNPGKGGYFSPYNIDHITDGKEGEYLTDRLTNEAISFVKKAKDTTFFLYLPYYTVHTPIMGKPKLIEKFRDKKGNIGQNNPKYAAMVASLDENVGRLLASLKVHGVDENTLVILTSDNGGIRAISNQNPLKAGKGSYYEGGIRVPLVVKWPKKIKKETKTSQIVSNLDFYPTIQNLVQPGKKAKELDGLDLTNVFLHQKIIERDLFYHFPIYLQAYSKKKDQGRDPLFRTRPGSVLISGQWKLHHYYEDDVYELYNLQADIGETKNLINVNSDKAEELREKLRLWLKKNNAPIPREVNPFYKN